MTGMITGYRAALALTSVLLLAASPPHRHPHHRHHHAQPAPAANAIYSRRALREARTILQLKLLELRSERLERARKVIERRLPLDELFKEPPGAPVPMR
jgi:hypothetical protein